MLITGNQNKNLLSGTNEGDTLDGGAGDDILRARKGDDTLWGRAGNDRLFGDAGDDDLFGGDGRDYMDGGANNDLLMGEDGNDQLFGRDGDDILYGEAGDDVIFGGIGNDIISGGQGSDVLTGNHGADDFRFDFQWRDDLQEGFDGWDTTHATITDYQSGIDDLAITFESWGQNPFTGEELHFEDVLTIADLDTDGSGIIDGADAYTAVESESLVINLENLYQTVPGAWVHGEITLLDVTSLRAGDLIA